MVKRLSEMYKLQQAVEVLLHDPAGERWTPGTVVNHDFPGVWVRTDEGGLWFVTNRGRIRAAMGTDESPEKGSR